MTDAANAIKRLIELGRTDLAQDVANIEAERDRLRSELDALRKQEPACVIDVDRHGNGVLVAGSLDRGIHKLYATPVPPAADDTIEQATKYAHDIVTWLHRDHYADNTAFEPFSDLLGLLSQIDNMICGWKEQPAAVAVQDVPWVITVESSEVYSPSGEKWKDIVSATPAPVAQEVPDGYTPVRTDELLWLLGENGEFECPQEQYFRGNPAPYFWRRRLRAAMLAATPAPAAHVGDSQFESWFSTYNPKGKGDK